MEKKSLKKRLPDAWKNFKAAFNEIPGVFVWIVLGIALMVASIVGLATAEKPDLQIIGTGSVTFKADTAFVKVNGTVLIVDAVITEAKDYTDSKKCVVSIAPREGMEVTAFTQRPSAQPEFLLGKTDRDGILAVTDPYHKYHGLQAFEIFCLFIVLFIFYACGWAIKSELKEKKVTPAPDADS